MACWLGVEWSELVERRFGSLEGRISLGDVTSDLRRLTSCRQIHIGDGKNRRWIAGDGGMRAKVVGRGVNIRDLEFEGFAWWRAIVGKDRDGRRVLGIAEET